jgi:hypothetical protein
VPAQLAGEHAAGALALTAAPAGCAAGSRAPDPLSSPPCLLAGESAQLAGEHTAGVLGLTAALARCAGASRVMLCAVRLLWWWRSARCALAFYLSF